MHIRFYVRVEVLVLHLFVPPTNLRHFCPAFLFREIDVSRRTRRGSGAVDQQHERKRAGRERGWSNEWQMFSTLDTRYHYMYLRRRSFSVTPCPQGCESKPKSVAVATTCKYHTDPSDKVEVTDLITTFAIECESTAVQHRHDSGPRSLGL